MKTNDKESKELNNNEKEEKSHNEDYSKVKENVLTEEFDLSSLDDDD